MNKAHAGFQLVFQSCIAKSYLKMYLVSPKRSLWLSVMGRKYNNFACYRLLENAISNVNLGV